MNTQDAQGNVLLDFFGRTSTLIGGVTALPAMAGVFVVSHNPLLSLGFGAVGYLSGFLLSSGSKQTIDIGGDSAKVEIDTLNKNIQNLKITLDEHSKHISPRIIASINSIFDILEDILPKWQELAGFGEDKHTINAIISDYLPDMLNDYMKIPDSRYRYATKARSEERIVETVETLEKELIEISDKLYAGVEQKINTTSSFLKDKYEYKNSLTL